jgi:hypothetical protein
MIIKCDKEGMQVIQQLLDLALKATGLQNLQQVNEILKIIKLEDESETNR